jgi:hypothetical protein
MVKFEATGNASEDIPALIKHRGNGLSFVELLQGLPYLEGDCIYENGEWNFVFWGGLSQQCIDTLRDLINRDVIKPTPAHPLTYYVDGRVPNLPLAKSPRKYKKPHWAPITFSLGERAA